MEHFLRSDEVELGGPSTDFLLLIPSDSALGDVAFDGEGGV
jgi:hypothetical protein